MFPGALELLLQELERVAPRELVVAAQHVEPIRATLAALSLDTVVRELAGHGVGEELHEPPEIPNFGDPGRGPILKTGMVLAIEPMVNAGVPGVETLKDGWTVVTADRKLSAHFEHTVAVSETGADILTATS